MKAPYHSDTAFFCRFQKNRRTALRSRILSYYNEREKRIEEGEIMSEHSVLLVEDEPEIREDNRSRLVRAGYRVLAAGTLQRARELIAEHQPELIVLDVMLPDGSGLELCREIRPHTAASILFLTSLGESEQVISGLRAGADDYMVKPFVYEELLARIEAQFRRLDQAAGQRQTVSFHGLTIDPAAQRAYLQGRDLQLKPKEFLLLAALLHGRADFHTASELYAAVWGMASNEDVRTVLVHISNLRAKLRQVCKEPPVVIRRYGNEGYRLEPAESEE